MVVTTPGGSNAANTLYSYFAAPTVSAISPTGGPLAGGTSVTITGTNFTGATGVTIGGVYAGSLNNSGELLELRDAPLAPSKDVFWTSSRVSWVYRAVEDVK